MLENAIPRLERNEQGQAVRVWLSAATGQGLELLDQAIAERLSGETRRHVLHLEPTEAGLRARLFELANVLKDEADDTGGWTMEIEISSRVVRLLRDYGRADTLEDGEEREIADPV